MDSIMELDIEILSGHRKGTRFSMPLRERAAHQIDAMPYVLETEALAFFVTLKDLCDSITLTVGGQTTSLRPYAHSDSDDIAFELQPRYLETGAREAFFNNYFGAAQFEITLEYNGKSSHLESGPIEVLARKSTADQAERMVSFILEESNADLENEAGTTRFHSSGEKRADQLNRVVTYLLEHTEQLEKLSPNIIARPLKALSSAMCLQSAAELEIHNDQGMAWLIENLSLLEETDDSERAHFYHQNRAYRATELFAPVVQEHTDLYENRILHGYLESLLNFTQDILSHYEPDNLSHLQNSYDGYISFFACMESWLDKANTQQLNTVQHCQDRLLVLQRLYQRALPVRKTEHIHPRITNKVKGHRDYLSLFHSLIKWYQNNQIDWHAQQLFLAIQSMPDLFEYYSLLRIRRWCQQNGRIYSDYSKHYFWHGMINQLEIGVYYEPNYWASGHAESSDDLLVNSEQRFSFSDRNVAYLNDYNRSHPNARRSPDIVLEVKRAGQLLGLFVMDAKYTTREQAFRHYLPECTMKYVHGIAHKQIGGLVKSMIIVYPDQKDRWLDFHAPPFGIHDSQPQLPALGAQGLSLLSTNESNPQSLEKLLTSLLQQL